jgi:hypothetical protein
VIYQVLTRGYAGSAWAAYASPTCDPYDVVLLIQAANQHYAEVTVLQAESVVELVEVLSRMRGGALPEDAVSPIPGLTTTPRVRVEEPAMDRRRWELERGLGGDHDQPYTFILPRGMEVRAAWTRLMARRWRGLHRDDEAAA